MSVTALVVSVVSLYFAGASFACAVAAWWTSLRGERLALRASRVLRQGCPVEAGIPRE